MVALKDLVGSWRLVKYEELPVDGSPTALPLGDRPKGYIIYSADGFMAAFLSSTDERSRADPIAYAGPYSVDEEQQVVHQPPGENVSFGQGLAQRAFISQGT